MKLFTLFFFFLTTQAFAQSHPICAMTDSYTFQEEVDAGRIKLLGEKKDRFNALETRMIVSMIKLEDWREVSSVSEALAHFQDRGQDGRIGSNAGEVSYYNFKGRTIALVHYYPGDNEYGAYFELPSPTTFKLVAKIGDGDIYCGR